MDTTTDTMTTPGAALLRQAWVRTRPALATAALVGAGRWWHDEGGHRILDTLAVGGLAAVTAVVGARLDREIAGPVLAAAGGLAGLAVVGASTGWALPAGLWALATGVAYLVSARHWRAEAAVAAEHDRAVQLHITPEATAVQVAAIQAGAAVRAAELAAIGTTYAATAIASGGELTPQTRAALAAAIPHMQLSPTAAAALGIAPPATTVVDVALEALPAGETS